MGDALQILLVEDNRTNLALMQLLVDQLPGCRAMAYSSPTEVAAALPGLAFDAAIVDYQMPDLDGVELIRLIRQNAAHRDKPVVMVTADHDVATKLAAIEAGAMEFLHKPVEPVEFKARIRNLAALCSAQRELRDRARWLREEVDKATLELRQREEEIIVRLTLAAGYKDQETAAHTIRMAAYCGALARQLGLPENYCRDIQLAAQMHDIGKVGIRDEILQKRGRLDDLERAHINTHTQIGSAILEGSQSELLRLAGEIALSHHERWDGSGYPHGLRGVEIPRCARIAAVADVFDALTTERPYKAAWSMDRAFDYLRENAATQFDPDCVEAFSQCRVEIQRIAASLPDTEYLLKSA